MEMNKRTPSSFVFTLCSTLDEGGMEGLISILSSLTD
jgi:hypothetical protein